MADLEIAIAKRSVEPINISLTPPPGSRKAKDVYVFTPPKQAAMILPMLEKTSNLNDEGMAATAAMFDWLGEGLSDADNARLEARLRDKNDDLDIDTMGDIIKGIMEKIGDRPTT